MRHGTLRKTPGPARGFGSVVGGNHVTLLHDGERFFPAMLSAIESAEREVLVEMYWFASDRTGRRFAEALAARARQGVDVRVLYDAVGSWETDEEMFDAMRAAGCRVEQYNPIAPWRKRFKLGVVNNRDHRKMLVVDGRTGFVGGLNLGDEWAPEADGGQGWREDVVRVQGPAVRQMRDLFDYTWSLLVGRQPLAVPTPPATPEGESPVRVLASHYRGDRRAIRRAYLERIRAARRRICITNSYFVPERVVRRALAAAVRRGVEVRVLLPGESDVPAVSFAGRRLYSWLLERGVRLFEWQGNILHSKTAVVDGEWCAVGSYNLDYRSWRFNLESIVTIDDPSVAEAMEQQFERDLQRAGPIELRHWRYRSLSERGLEWFFYRFRKLL